MVDKKEIENYFLHHKKEHSLKQLLEIFQVPSKDVNEFLDILVSLEEEGKLIFDEQNKCISIGEDYYLKNGYVKQSNRGNYYIDCKNKGRINLVKESLSNIAIGDHVFVKEETNTSHHKMYREGKVVRKTVRPQMEEDKEKHLIKGIVEKEAGNNRLYIRVDNRKIYLNEEQCNSAYPGDTVTALISLDSKAKADVKRVTERKNSHHVFECQKDKDTAKWIPIGTHPFPIKQTPSRKFQNGDRVMATITSEKPCEFNIEIVKKISNKSSPNSMIEAILIDNGFQLTFSDKVNQETNKLTNKITSTELAARKDLRGLKTFTIDSETAKDLDDAVSIEKIGDNYKLYVHIADVSHYINPTSSLFLEAITRGTSIYPPNMVIPMLPKKLSNNLCSLNPKEDKLTKTCEITISSTGKIIDYNIYKSIISSDCKMTYQKVNQLLTGQEYDEEYLTYYHELMEMYQLSNILQNQRLKRGFLNFQTEELQMEVDDFGNPITVKNRTLGVAEILIENFMVLANTVVAEYAYWLNLPFTYRNHEIPKPEKSKQLEKSLSNYNKEIKRIQNINNPKVLQSLLVTLTKGKSKDEIHHISSMFLTSLPKAYYSCENIGHYGLALNCYGTFTSPIRRASDLLNHMFLDEVLVYNMEDSRLGEVKSHLEQICAHISNQQQNADQVETEINRRLLYQLGLQYQGIPLIGKITFLTENGISIKTAHEIPGYIPINKKCKYNAKNNSVFDSRDNMTYHIGDEIPILLSEKQTRGHNGELLFKKELSYKKEEKAKQLYKKKEIKQ